MAKEKQVKEKKEKNYLEELAELTANPYATVADQGTTGDVSGYITTGSYLLNALLGGSMFTGLANNKITIFAGESSTGKTYLVLDIIRHFLNDNPDGHVVFFESESAISKQMFVERGMDARRILMLPIDTVQNYRTQILKIIDKYLNTPKSQRKPLLFVLDSLGMLSTTKELEDTAEGKETADMTRSKLIKATFRVITLKLGLAGVPHIMTNHTYMEQGLFAKKVMCLVGETEIRTASGNIPISEIKVGQEVMTVTGLGKTTDVFKYKTNKLFEIEMEDGTIVRCTGDHKFLTPEMEWLSVKNMIANDSICVLD
jgi:RecA/RadA recombinase